jgi:hypothetical protein
MHLLYIDDSGSANDTKRDHCVLAGFSVYERQVYYLEKSIDEIVAKHIPHMRDIELHATCIRTGKGEWRRIDSSLRRQILIDILLLVKNNFPKNIRLFASVISKKKIDPREDVQTNLFMQVISRFDMFLSRLWNYKGDPARGIAIFDKCTSELAMQKWTHSFKDKGNRYGKRLRNIAEVPLCLDSKMSRLIQLADIIAYGIFRYFEFDDDTYYSVIKDCFDYDSQNNKVYGLHSLTDKK